MIEHIGAVHKAGIRQPTNTGHQFYFNPRDRYYPALVESGVTYTRSTTASYCFNTFCGTFASASLAYQYTVAQKFLIDMRIKPAFAYDIATDCPFINDYLPDSNYSILYNKTTDKIDFTITGTDATVTLSSTAFTSTVSLNNWYRCVAYADVAGSSFGFYVLDVDNTLLDSSTSTTSIGTFTPHAVISVASTPYAATNSSTACNIQYLKVANLTGLTITNPLSITGRYPEIYFNYNGATIGYERIKITDKVKGYSTEFLKEKRGGACANRATVTLLNIDGCFSDDQYAAFSPKDDQFNGTNLQKYLQRRVPIQIHIERQSAQATPKVIDEIVFTGKSTRGAFTRTSPHKYYGESTVQATDYITELYTKRIPDSKVYQGFSLCAASNSLFNSIAKISTDVSLKNYCCNSGFENTTVGNSWVAVAGSIARSSAVTLFGSYVGLVTGASADIRQRVDFDYEDLLNVTDYFSLSCYLRGVSAGNVVVKITEYTSAGTALTNYTQVTTAVITTDWRRAELTHTIVGTTASQLAIDLVYVDCGFYIDRVSLFRTKEAIPWGFSTTKDCEDTGVGNADLASSASYTMVPIDVDYIADTTVSFYRIDEGTRVLDYLNDIMDAGISRYCGMTCDGILQYRNYLGGADYPNNGTVDASKGVNTRLESEEINKIKVHGVVLKKTDQMMVVWEAEASNLFDRLSTGGLSHTISAGAYCMVGTDKDYDVITARFGEVGE